MAIRINKIILSVMIGTLCFSAPAVTYAAESDNTIQVKDSYEPEPYHDDEWFKDYAQKAIDAFEKDGDAKKLALLKTYILNGWCSYDQVHYVIEQGYFCSDDDIGLLKDSRYIEYDYTLPSDVKLKESFDSITKLAYPDDIPEKEFKESYYKDSTTLPHTFNDLGEDTERAILDLLQDDDNNDAYIYIAETAEDKKIAGEYLAVAAYNDEWFSVGIKSKDYPSETAYKWFFPNVLYLGHTDLNLDVDHDDTHISFDLGDNVPARVILKVWMNDPEHEYNIFDKNGKLIETQTTDADGFLWFGSISRSADYVLERSPDVETPEDTTENVTPPEAEFQKINPPSRIIIIILLSVLIVVAIISLIIGIWINKKPRRRK